MQTLEVFFNHHPIGVQANLAESYRWFALAAGNGDADAARKRDEVAARLDQQALTAAKLVGETAGIDRFRSAAAFARHNGTAPVPVWSGRFPAERS